MKIVKYIFLILITVFVGCKSKSKNKVVGKGIPPLTANIQFNKDAYKAGDLIKTTISLENKSEVAVVVEDLALKIVNISKGSDSIVKELKNVGFKWKAGEKHTETLNIELPKAFKEGAYGVYITQKQKGFEADETYETFFRIITDDELTVFNIETEKVKGVPVFKLDGGMSAEYIVEKSAENLTSGISHSWEVNAPGSGPNHVLGTPNYLEKSVNKTVEFYNKTFGDDAEIETVLISTGFPSIPYISNALKAPVLPLHFLVSVNTAKEIQTILKTANDNGIASYATLSHDPSVPYAVSWIKLLELPQAYKNFIKKHNVKNVVILGATGTNGGETKAKQLLYDNNLKGEYADRSIYIMYPGTSPDDVKTLNDKIVDLKDFKQQENFIQIADWESGINQKQLTNFVADAKSINNSVNAITITAESLGRLYALGGYSTLALMHKNKDKFSDVKGVIFNPYLIAHPTIEMKKGFVPLLYWQLVGANYTVYNMENDLLKAIKHYYPQTNPKKLKLWLNSTRNFGAKWSANNLKKELTKKGYTNFVENNYEVDEVWDLSDEVDSPSEKLFKEIDKTYGFDNLKKWRNSLKSLSIEDMKELSELFGGFEVEVK
ncbi:hypothetical protein JL193_16495 [Polaribacter batillariae]|uniref:Uncharacterized protein n=1 Tax=Polaribacter batillariae TaxID=2808900 RepID=A0ABX7STR9_9FLAO|nr:hypothetical protein [Polaribacter batillariae]QTD37642.1 hypothetical protein JL193_16495 [Polaribacter batillariae]